VRIRIEAVSLDSTIIKVRIAMRCAWWSAHAA